MNDNHRELPDLEAFPTDFTWGAATSAYQIEGSADRDGKGPSIWDTFVRVPGAVVDATTGDTATDSYRRGADDIALMRDLGLDAYRFSICWPRIHPDGGADVNQPGLDHYRRFVDDLLAAGITPWITLYHWDLPQALETAGGWPHRDTADRFADFADTVTEALGDRVKRWITVNEPWCAAFLGYASGEHAPGRREPLASIAAAHHLLLGHGKAVAAMRARHDDLMIGPGLNFYGVHPATESEADRDAARRIDGMQNRFFTDAILRGRYPSDVLDDLSTVGALDFIRDGDLDVIAAPVDLLCANYYSRFTVTGSAGGVSSTAAPTGAGSPWPGNSQVGFIGSGLPVTGMDWEIDPGGLRDLLLRLARDYPGVPLVVSENGAAFDDVHTDSGVHDPERLGYFHDHIAACGEAIAAGAPLTGYFAWSLLDNFEWAWGYTKRFGLIGVDYSNQKRIIKDSGHWYSAVIDASRL